MDIEVKAYDEKGVLHSFLAEIDKFDTKLSFDKRDTKIIKTKKLGENIKEYNNNFTFEGTPVEKRKLYTYLGLENREVIERDLARIFIISTFYMHIDQIDSFSNDSIYNDFVKDANDKFLNDRNVLEWTGELNIQPGIYFLKKDFVENNIKSIEKFYKLGLLYYYSIQIGNTSYNNYLFPFTEKNIKNYKIFAHMEVWNKIIKMRNAELLRFINGNRK